MTIVDDHIVYVPLLLRICITVGFLTILYILLYVSCKLTQDYIAYRDVAIPYSLREGLMQHLQRAFSYVFLGYVLVMLAVGFVYVLYNLYLVIHYSTGIL